MGPTTTTEVKYGMNLCDPLMKKQLSGFMDRSVEPSRSKHWYEVNMVICEANEICQPLLNFGELAKIGYIFFSFLKFTRPNPPLGLAEIGRDVLSLGFHNSSRCEWR